MNRVLKLEEFGMVLLCLYGFYILKVEWWVYILVLFGPDISMLGYLAGNKVGAVIYNFLHHKGIAAVIFICGLYFQDQLLQVAGIILFGHSSLDRVMGYGLKYFEGFGYTHLGLIGKNKN